MVIDDDRSAEVLRRFLEVEGFSVVCAISAEDAIVMVPKQTLALITLDLQMYGMNGWQFLLKLRESGQLAQVPVIVVSGRPIAKNLAESSGAAALLQKPISRVRLKATLANLGLLQTLSVFAR